jgi:hypothetical protein
MIEWCSPLIKHLFGRYRDYSCYEWNPDVHEFEELDDASRLVGVEDGGAVLKKELKGIRTRTFQSENQKGSRYRRAKQNGDDGLKVREEASELRQGDRKWAQMGRCETLSTWSKAGNDKNRTLLDWANKATPGRGLKQVGSCDKKEIRGQQLWHEARKISGEGL